MLLLKIVLNKGQDYDYIKRNFNSEKLFTDEIFKANMDALAYSDEFKQSFKNLKWMRPKVSFISYYYR